MMMVVVWQMDGWIMIYVTLMQKACRVTRNMAAVEVPLRRSLKLMRSGERLMKLRRVTSWKIGSFVSERKNKWYPCQGRDTSCYLSQGRMLSTRITADS